MQTTLEIDAIGVKTRELCQSILDMPEFQDLRKKIDAFMADDEARSQYQTVSELGEQLHHKQHSGSTLAQEEIANFETHRDALFNNGVARDFMDARQRFQEIQQSVTKLVSKTLETGRVPTEAEMEEGCCGDHSCGCSH